MILNPSPLSRLYQEVFELPMRQYNVDIQLFNTWRLFYIFQVKDMKFKIILFFLFVTVFGVRQRLKDNGVQPQQVKTVVQSNHFFSNIEKNTTYTINNIKKNEPLVFMLKDSTNKQTLSLAQNPITISLNSKGQKATCTFNNQSNMCSLKNATEDEIELKINCKRAPCELSWVIVQPAALDKDGQHKIDNLVQINKDYNHAGIVVTCNDPNLKDFHEKIKLFTNSKYNKVTSYGIVYYLFDNEEKGYYFMTTDDVFVRNCVKVEVRHAPDSVQFRTKSHQFYDFLSPDKINSYDIKKLPDTDFRIEAFIHTVKGQKISEKKGLQISLIGEKGSERTKLQTITVVGEDREDLRFSVVFKKPSVEYKTYVIDLKSLEKQILIMSLDFRSDQRHDVTVGLTTYFHLKSGDKINFKLVPQSETVDASKLIHIFSSNDSLFVPSLNQCKARSGCQFTLQAKADGEGDLYFGKSQTKNVTEEIVIEFEKSVTKKLREDETIIFKRKIKAKKSIQAVVNSPNVLIYAATKQKCPVINRQCHQRTLNSHNPFIYQIEKDVDLYFLVRGLDNCEFTLTIIEEGTEYIELQDTKPFTYLFDDSEKEIIFTYKLEKKEDVNFNLIGPVNQLKLLVLNGQKFDQSKQPQVTSEGFLSFNKDDIDSLHFVIKIQKSQQFSQKFIHFTLLASTSEGNIRLQPGITHFQTIKPEQTRDYVFEFQPKKQILLNLYTHNVKPPLNIQIRVSTTDQYEKSSGMLKFTLDQQSEVLDLQTVSSQLCKQRSAANCQLFVRLFNNMDVQLDITLTLMIRDSIIQLKDGVWNSFKATEVTKTSHFYFLPKHPNKSVTILYKATLVELKIMYTLWKTDDKSVDPTEWPFPMQIKSQNTSLSPLLQLRPTKIVHITAQSFKECWPNCVILVTVFQDKNSVKNEIGSFSQNPFFMIMASNNYIEVPQKQKIDIILNKDEEKHLLVDLKYVLEKKALTFFTYFTMGSVTLTGNVYDQQNPRCPTLDEISDFRFGNVQTQISMQTVKRKLQENGMSQDKHAYICILAKAYDNSKFSLEYDSNEEIIVQIIVDTSYVHKANAGDVKIFQADASNEFVIKITRNEGFPYIDKVVCNETTDLETCLSDFKQRKQKGEQIADKIYSLAQQPCNKCILFFKVSSPQPSQVIIHSQSKFSETELQENRIMTDSLKGEQINKYLVTSIKNQEVILNIQITHGSINVYITDFDGTVINKTNEKGSNHISIKIPVKNVTGNPFSSFGRTFFSNFGQSTVFGSYHVQIKSVDPKVNALYTITYSSGQQETYLQDGLISTFILFPEKQSKYLYKNPTLSKIYLHISVPTAEGLNKLQVKIMALNDQYDSESGVEMTPQKVNFNKKTPNPTMIVALPANKFFEITLGNNNKQMQLVTIGINNQQIIYLPFAHEFPVQLHKGEHIYVVVNSGYMSYVQVQIKKCGESLLTVAYTTDYQEFTQQQFSHEQQLDYNELITFIQVRLKNKGSIYLKLKSSENDVSVVTMKATLLFSKTAPERPSAGARGLISYKLLDSSMAELDFTPLQCPSYNKNCQKDFAYSSISAPKLDAVYAQLVCPTVAFDLEDRQIVAQGKAIAIASNANAENKIVFQSKLSGDIEYIGVKAVNNKTGEVVIYKPIEIATFWGQVQKNSQGSGFVFIIVVVSLGVCCLLVAYRRRKRSAQTSEYAPLDSIQ